MAVSVSAQTLVFLFSCALGAALGALFDVFRMIRLAVPCSRPAVFLQDVLFLLACTVVTFFFMLCESAGKVRLYIVEGELLGAVLYSLTLGALVMKLFRLILNAAGRAKSGLVRTFAPPAKKVFRKINGLADRSESRAKGLAGKEHKLFKIRLKNVQKVLYNLLHVQKAHNEAEKSN